MTDRTNEERIGCLSREVHDTHVVGLGCGTGLREFLLREIEAPDGRVRQREIVVGGRQPRIATDGFAALGNRLRGVAFDK